MAATGQLDPLDGRPWQGNQNGRNWAVVGPEAVVPVAGFATGKVSFGHNPVHTVEYVMRQPMKNSNCHCELGIDRQISDRMGREIPENDQLLDDTHLPLVIRRT